MKKAFEEKQSILHLSVIKNSNTGEFRTSNPYTTNQFIYTDSDSRNFILENGRKSYSIHFDKLLRIWVHVSSVVQLSSESEVVLGRDF